MTELDRDIEIVRSMTRDAASRGDWTTWLLASCFLTAWRLARWLGWAR